MTLHYSQLTRCVFTHFPSPYFPPSLIYLTSVIRLDRIEQTLSFELFESKMERSFFFLHFTTLSKFVKQLCLYKNYVVHSSNN